MGKMTVRGETIAPAMNDVNIRRLCGGCLGQMYILELSHGSACSRGRRTGQSSSTLPPITDVAVETATSPPPRPVQELI